MSDFNSRIVDEYRANGGRMAGRFSHMPILLLHHKGAKTGTERVNPLAYREVEGGWAVFASKAGADTNPDWFHNLMANPETRVEIGEDVIDVRARLTEGEERNQIWEAQKSEFANFAAYEAKTSRERIPVIVLEES